MWREYRGGKRWKIASDGRIEVEDEGYPLSNGAPKTMQTLFEEYGPSIKQVCAYFELPVPWLAGMIPIEAARLKANRFSMDPISLRYERGYKDPISTPRKVSAGLTQCLLATAQEMATRYKLASTFMGEERALGVGDLMQPLQSLYYGAAYMDYHRKRFRAGRIKGLVSPEMDFVLMTGAYNAGKISYDVKMDNPFHLLTHSATRTLRAIEWHNDCYRPEVMIHWATPEQLAALISAS